MSQGEGATGSASAYSSVLLGLPDELQLFVIGQCVEQRGLIARTCKSLSPFLNRTARLWAPQLNIAHSRSFVSGLRGFETTMCRSGHRVRELTLPLGTRIDTPLFRDVLARLPFLHVLRCFNCTHPLNGEQQPWAQLVDVCNNLREMRVQGLSSNPLCDLALTAFAKLPYLHTLCVPGSDVTNAGLLKLAEGGQQLKHLDLSNCRQIRGRSFDDELFLDSPNRMTGLVQLITTCGASLQKLELAAVDVDHEVMTAIGSHCPQLEELDVAFGVYDDDGVANVLRGCPLLSSLSVKASFIDDPSLFAMASPQCPHLTALDLSGCVSLTADAVLHLVQARPLTVLMLAAETYDPDELHAGEVDAPGVDANVILALAATSADSLRVFSVENVIGLPTDALLPLLQKCRKLVKVVSSNQGQKATELFCRRPRAASGFTFLSLAHNAFDPCWTEAEHAPFLKPAMPSWVGGGRQRFFGELMRLPWNRVVLPDITLLTAPVETLHHTATAFGAAQQLYSVEVLPMFPTALMPVSPAAPSPSFSVAAAAVHPVLPYALGCSQINGNGLGQVSIVHSTPGLPPSPAGAIGMAASPGLLLPDPHLNTFGLQVTKPQL